MNITSICIARTERYVLKREYYMPCGIRFLSQLNLLVETHYKQRRDIEFYASALNISIKVLNRRLKVCQGITFSKFIQQRILLEAIRILTDCDKSIKEIAYELGFADPSHFTRYFKKFTNLTPNDARKLYKQLMETT